jgi:hypothetical protein
MIRPRFNAILIVIILAITAVPGAFGYAAGTDEIKNYAIDILPQGDASLVNTYTINWCVISNSAGPLTWITVGMPNEQYEILSSSGDIASVSPYNEGFDYQIKIDLPREVNAGDCVEFTVQVHQYGMAYLDESTNQISFQFTPGWFNDVPVNHLQVTWHLPSQTTHLKSLNPKPTTQNEALATWESDLQPGEKFPIAVIYDRAEFPDFNPGQTGLPSSTNPSPPGSDLSTPSSATSIDVNEPGTQAPVLESLSLSTCLCICVILILVLIVIVVLFNILGSSSRSYRGGGFFGGYPIGGGWTSGGGGFGWGSGGGVSIPRRSGGGGGLFGGRGRSCACVSSGCACACAGGGRAGCSRKGFDVSGLVQDGRKENSP